MFFVAIPEEESRSSEQRRLTSGPRLLCLGVLVARDQAFYPLFAFQLVNVMNNVLSEPLSCRISDFRCVAEIWQPNQQLCQNH